MSLTPAPALPLADCGPHLPSADALLAQVPLIGRMLAAMLLLCSALQEGGSDTKKEVRYRKTQTALGVDARSGCKTESNIRTMIRTGKAQPRCSQ